jgi:GNAT superfamily N-acetyltransferase
MQRLELDAGRRFADAGLQSIADDPPSGHDVLMAYINDQAAWMAVDEHSQAQIGYAVSSVVDGEAHLDQVSVSMAAAGRGVGSLLVSEVFDWAVGRGYDAITLTTFRDLAWNGPLYQRLGFVALTDTECGPQLLQIRTEERRRGIDVLPRVAMRRTLSHQR